MRGGKLKVLPCSLCKKLKLYLCAAKNGLSRITQAVHGRMGFLKSFVTNCHFFKRPCAT
jgi:hypothetical protein